jgi:uncharacterized protein YeeX (DUF496 family)
MNGVESQRRKAIKSAHALLELLNQIRTSHQLNMDQKEALEDDEKAIREIANLLHKIQSKEQIRDIWNKMNQMKRDFGGYIGNEDGNRIEMFMDNLWSNVLNLYQKL